MKSATIYIDEAGRGPLAGPVYVGAVYLLRQTKLSDYKDSKKCSPKQREQLFAKLQATPQVAHAWGSASAAYIDTHGIIKAINHAITQAIKKLQKTISLPQRCRLVIDGNHDFWLRKQGYEVETIIKGDDLVPAISAASIVAKVSRDHYMDQQSQKHPQYQFHKHKGYGTKLHYEMIKKYGMSKLHRKTFLKNS